MINFDELCKARAKAGEKKYLVYSCTKCGRVFKELTSMHNEWNLCPKCLSAKGIQPVNAALYRNSALDVAEELADAVNIAQLWANKEDAKMTRHAVVCDINQLIAEVTKLGKWMMLYAQEGRDDYPVKRIGFEEVKQCDH